MDEITLETAQNFKGYLSKKSPSLFAGYQKRYFKVLDGKLLTYSEKEGGEAKGAINIELISEIITVDKTTYIIFTIDLNLNFKIEILN